MKKATNSKNRGKISKLFTIMQEHLGQSMNLARIKLMALLLEALVKAQTVSHVRLANAMDTAADKESNMRILKNGRRAMSVVRYGLMEIESVLQRTCYKDKYDIFKFLSCT